MDCAREMRGTASMASAVMLRVASLSTTAGSVRGLRRLMRVAPSRMLSSSSSLGGLILAMMSAAQVVAVSPMCAPASR